MRIITGSTGQTHVTSNNDGEFNQSIWGDGLVVLSNGEQLEATMIDYNTIQIADGDLVMQGRHALIEPGTTDTITIETGQVGMNRNDLIVARYALDSSTGYEKITLEVVKGTETSGTPSDPEITEGVIRTGATLAEAALYRVKIENVQITNIEKLFVVNNHILDKFDELKSEIGTKIGKNEYWLNSKGTGINSTLKTDFPLDDSIKNYSRIVFRIWQLYPNNNNIYGTLWENPISIFNSGYNLIRNHFELVEGFTIEIAKQSDTLLKISLMSSVTYPVKIAILAIK